MTNDWIIDVLTDLQKFSASNKMGRLAERLDDTIALASRELSTQFEAPRARVGEIEQAGRFTGGAVTRDNA